MEALIRPEFGLMFWTIVCFVLLVTVLSRTAWRPLMQAIEEREKAIKGDLRAAETARAEAETAREGFESKLSELKAEISGRMEEARAAALKEKDALIEEARRSAALIVEASRREIEAQKLEASSELRSKVAELSVLAAERILLKQLDHRANTDLASKYLAELESEKPELKLGNN
jgi:F-type H+-transporting ATPase subunit b